MKTIRITLTKDGARAACTNRYHWTDYPESSVWTGDRMAFRLRDGRPLALAAGIDALEETTAFQAAQCGAAFTIEDLGGEATMWTDNVFSPVNPSLSSAEAQRKEENT